MILLGFFFIIFSYFAYCFFVECMHIIRYGASAQPSDGGTNPVIALLDKLMETSVRQQHQQLTACLKILLKTLPMIEMPYKVSIERILIQTSVFLDSYFRCEFTEYEAYAFSSIII